jgi:hypothetical protein
MKMIAGGENPPEPIIECYTKVVRGEELRRKKTPGKPGFERQSAKRPENQAEAADALES